MSYPRVLPGYTYLAVIRDDHHVSWELFRKVYVSTDEYGMKVTHCEYVTERERWADWAKGIGVNNG